MPSSPPTRHNAKASRGSFYVEGLVARILRTPEAAKDLLDYAMTHRTIGHSYLIERSSRAHTVCRLVLATEPVAEPDNKAW